MIELAISLLWILIGVISAVIYFVFYVLDSVMGIGVPERIKQAVWADRADPRCHSVAVAARGRGRQHSVSPHRRSLKKRRPGCQPGRRVGVNI